MSYYPEKTAKSEGTASASAACPQGAVVDEALPDTVQENEGETPRSAGQGKVPEDVQDLL